MNIEDFRKVFCELTVCPSPFPWQEKLFWEFSKGNFPSCSLPTGMGKTAVIALWLIALAYFPHNVPRRLAYAVNRRTVVDQTSEEVEIYRKRLEGAQKGSALENLRSKLTELCALPFEDNSPLALSTLRGQLAESREWSSDPCRPAVISGTVDLIGSRLLFRGYRSGFKTKPLYAGFLGQDTLLVHDESHLEPAFQKLLDDLVDEQKKSLDREKGLKVMALSATIKAENKSTLFLSQEDESNIEVAKRFKAHKALSLIPTDGKIAETVTQKAQSFAKSGKAILIFLRTVDDVEKVANALRDKCVTLTGTMRGKERDDLVNDSKFKRFLSKNTPSDQGTVYLVCTSAGEVGVNLSADHLICDLSTFESMAQRFGRVNRFGTSPDSTIQVIHPISFDLKDDLEKRRSLTLDLMKQLEGDASPYALGKLDLTQRSDAFSPEPAVLRVTDIILDSWSLTSITEKLPGRPEVAPYLHGITDNELPQTSVVWRTEVENKYDAILERYKPERLIELFPLKPRELLKDRSDRILKRLQELQENYPEKGGLRLWMLDDETEKIEIITLKEITSKNDRELIENITLILPPSMGGLDGNGYLNPESPKADDVSDIPEKRCRVWDKDKREPSMRLIVSLDTSSNPEVEEDDQEQEPKERFWNWYEAPKSGDTDGSRSALQDVELEKHSTDVENNVKLICQKLGYAEDLSKALVLAAKCHDLGKDRLQWQKSVGNIDPIRRLAKSKKPMKVDELDSYRHEFGSLLDISKRSDFRNLSLEMQDVVLHLIACHHGRGRPHFDKKEAFDPEGSGLEASSLALEVPRRFARLQRRYGRWGLAYLESLLRVADYAASSNSSPISENK